MHEHRILAACLKSREAFEKIEDLADQEGWSPEGGIIFRLCKEYYDLDKQAQTCDPEILKEKVGRELSSNKGADIVAAAIGSLYEMDTSAFNVAQEVVGLYRAKLGIKLASKLSASNPDKREIKELMKAYGEIEEVEDKDNSADIFSEVTATDLVRRDFDKNNLIQLYPKVLNDAIDGGLRGGHHVVIFAPVEMGKTLVAVNFCYGFLRQGLRTGYLINEEPPQDLMMRMMTRLTGMTKYEIIAEPQKADEILAGRNWDKFFVANYSPGTFKQIDSFIEDYELQVLIIDQLRNINVMSDNRTQGLEKAATEARNRGKRYDIPVISLTQAADSATGRRILERGDIDSSNVGIPAQADLMLGVGADRDMEESNMRMFSLVKNKIGTTHAPILVQIDPLHSRVVETGP